MRRYCVVEGVAGDYVAAMCKAARREAAFSIAERVVSQCNSATLDALCIRMTTLAVSARMAKRPLEEQTARKVLSLAESRLAELRAVG